MDFVVNPSSRLLDSQVSPFSLSEEFVLGDALEDVFRECDMSVLVVVVLVLVGVFDFLWEVRHA